MNKNVISIINDYICVELDEEFICKHNILSKIGEINNDNLGIIYAAEYGNVAIFEKIIERNINTYGIALKEACAGNHKSIIHTLINLIKEQWNFGLKGAFKSGDIEMINLMIKNGADNWDMALGGACQSGNIDMVKLAFKYGATNLQEGIAHACIENKPEIFELLMSNEKMQKIGIDTTKLVPTDDIWYFMDRACVFNSLDVIEHILNYIQIYDYDNLIKCMENVEFYNEHENIQKIYKLIKNKFPQFEI